MGFLDSYPSSAEIGDYASISLAKTSKLLSGDHKTEGLWPRGAGGNRHSWIILIFRGLTRQLHVEYEDPALSPHLFLFTTIWLVFVGIKYIYLCAYNVCVL